MAVYVTSDIHGCYTQFMNLLDAMSPSSGDELYVLGDIIDRGPKSAEMLVWAVDEAPANVHFLLGNHEDMAGCVIIPDSERMRFGFDEPWGYNGGDETRRQLLRKTDADWRAARLVPWLKALSPYRRIEAAGRPVMLVHAGFDPRPWNPDVWFTCDHSYDEHSHRKRVEVGCGFGEQSEQTMVWARWGWFDDTDPAPMETVFGHTPTLNVPRILRDAPELGPLSPCARKTRVWHCLNRHDVDCGCAYGGRLAGLRLDDMEEFYVRGYTDRSYRSRW